MTVFEYAEIGRWFVLHFHDLLTAISGYPGPNVLALSGTSWLPHSSRWHFPVLPQAVLEPDPSAQVAIAQSTFAFLRLTSPQRSQPLAISGMPDMRDRVREAAYLLASGPVPPLQDELRQLEVLGLTDPAWRDRKRALILVNSYDQAEVVAKEIGGMPGWRRQVFGLKRAEDGEDRWVEASRWSESLDRGSVERFAQTTGTILVAPLQAIGRGYNILNTDNIAAFGAIYFLIRLMPHPYDLQGYACELNRIILQWCADPARALWQRQSFYKQGIELRDRANRWWHATAQRQGYVTMSPAQKKDLAASMAGLVIQACGRLLRGGVPFHAYFVDAKWVPRSAARSGTDTPNTSLLAAMMAVLEEYVADPIGAALYQPLVEALRRTEECSISTTWNRTRTDSRARSTL